MKNNTVIFRGDPLEQMSFFYDLTMKIFYLNTSSMEEIKKSSEIVPENKIPPLLKDQIITENKDQAFFMLTSERETTEYKKIPETFLAVENVDNADYPYKILGAYSSRGLYIAPITGDTVYLQMSQKRLNFFIKSKNN